MIIVKPFKMYMFYRIFMTLCYVLRSMSIFTFEVYWEILCHEAFYFSGTIQLILGASQVKEICMVWVFTVKNIRTDYRFCCFNINKLSCYVIFRKGSCTTEFLLTQMPVSIDQWRGEIGCFNNRIALNFFLCSHDCSFKNLLPVFRFLLIALFCILLRKCSLIWVTFCTKLCLEISRNAISSFFYMLILICWNSSLILLIGDIKRNPSPISSSGQCFLIYYWNLNSITAHNYAKLPLLTACDLVHSFDIICLSETCLNSEIPPNDTRLELPVYNLFRPDHPSSNKRADV